MDSKTFTINCSACGASLTLPVEYAGKQGQCNKCGTTITARAQRRIRRSLSIACAIVAILAISTFLYVASKWGGGPQADSEHNASDVQQLADVGLAIDSPVVALPGYEIVKTEVEDVPSASGLVRRYIVITGGNVTRESLAALLAHESSIVSQIRGPKYHELPSHFSVHVYSSRVHWESADQRSIAWFFRGGSGSISSEIDEALIAEYYAIPTTKFGLTEEQRKLIWNDGCYGEFAARKAAEQAFPWPAWGESDQGKWKEFFENTRPKQSDMQDRLRRENDQIVINYYSITKEIYDAITNEGVERGWPIPPEVKGMAEGEIVPLRAFYEAGNERLTFLNRSVILRMVWLALNRYGPDGLPTSGSSNRGDTSCVQTKRRLPTFNH